MSQWTPKNCLALATDFLDPPNRQWPNRKRKWTVVHQLHVPTCMIKRLAEPSIPQIEAKERLTPGPTRQLNCDNASHSSSKGNSTLECGLCSLHYKNAMDVETRTGNSRISWHLLPAMSIAEHTQAGLVRYAYIACAVLVAYEHGAY